MKLVTQLRIALLFILLVGLSSAALHYWNLQQSRYQIRKMNISHTIYEGYLNLESHIYQLFKQYGDAIIIGDSNQRASKNRLIAQVGSDIEGIRQLIESEMGLIGADAPVKLAALADIERTVGNLISRLDQFSPTGSGELSSDWGRLSRLLNEEIDGKFQQMMRSALERKSTEVEATVEFVERAAIEQQKLTVFLALLGMFAVLLVVAMLDRRITRPLQLLHSGVRRFGEGQLDAQIKVPGWDEMAEIAASFNDMADKVAVKNRALTSEKEVLQKAVEARTHRLSVMLEDVKRIDESRKRMIADVSHELRTPLTIIKGEVDIALRGKLKDAEHYREALERSREAANHTARLVDDLLFVARTEAGEIRLNRAPIDLVTVINEVKDTFVHNAQLSSEIDKAPISGDAGRIRQALLVLLDNARHHGGDWVGITLRTDTGGYQVLVEDTGPGMSDDEKAQAFERFYRGSNAAERYREGAGLGLPVAQSIAHAHGGNIQLSDREGGGLVALLSLPFSDQRERAA